MTDKIIEDFLSASTFERLDMVEKPEHEQALKRFLGDKTYAAYQSLSGSLDRGNHLSLDHPTNLILVPGVMGSLLTSKGKGGVWWIDVRSKDHLKDLEISADGNQDVDRTFQIEPFNVDLTYEPFQTAVHNREDFGHTVFPYDWRKPFSRSTKPLRDLINKTFEENDNEKVHLVGHSMGGLMIRSMLMEYGDEDLWSKIGRIVFIATPHYGSPSIAGYLKNHFWGFEVLALLGLFLDRKTFRSMQGVLSLLPAPRGVYPDTRQGGEHPCANFDLYDVDAWDLDLSDDERSRLADVLKSVASFHEKMFDYHQNLDQEFKDRMLVIAGVGFKTLFRLEKKEGFLWDSTKKITSRKEGDKHFEGDGRVPLASAELENVSIRYAKGAHGELPNIPEVYEDVFNWLNEKSPQLHSTPEEATSGHLSIEAERIHLFSSEGTASASEIEETAPTEDELNIYSLNSPSEERIDALKKALESEQLPDFIRVKLL